MITPSEMAAKLRRASLEIRFGLDTEVRAAAKIGAEHSKSLIGSGEGAGWAPLAAATIERKEAGGFATPAPLLREGEMQDSISSEAETSGDVAEGLIYSDDVVAIFQELGTSYNPQGSPVPPRPFLMKGAMRAMEAVEPLLVGLLERALEG